MRRSVMGKGTRTGMDTVVKREMRCLGEVWADVEGGMRLLVVEVGALAPVLYGTGPPAVCRSGPKGNRPQHGSGGGGSTSSVPKRVIQNGTNDIDVGGADKWHSASQQRISPSCYRDDRRRTGGDYSTLNVLDGVASSGGGRASSRLPSDWVLDA